MMNIVPRNNTLSLGRGDGHAKNTGGLRSTQEMWESTQSTHKDNRNKRGDGGNKRDDGGNKI